MLDELSNDENEMLLNSDVQRVINNLTEDQCIEQLFKILNIEGTDL